MMWNIVKAAGSAVFQPVTQALSRRYNTVFSSLCHTLCQTQTQTSFLIPKPVITTQVAGLKVKGLLRERCPGCRRYMVGGRMFIYCMNFPKHNQKSIVKKHYNRWHLTSVSQGKLRPY